VTLAVETQQDFSMAMCPGIAPHLIPRNGVAKLVNFLIDEDGSPFKRSGATAQTETFGTTGLTFLWAGWLAGGQRTVVANAAALGVVNPADETDIVNVGGSGVPAACSAVEIAGILVIDGGTLYAGGLITAPYAAGSVKLSGPDRDGTPGQTTVVGTGTAWTANIDAGTLLRIGAKVFAVAAVTDDTHLELAVPYTGTLAAVSPDNGTDQFTVTLEGATGGTFVLIVGDDLTGAIASNATAATVQTAVQATPLGTAATVTGPAGGPWVVKNLGTSLLIDGDLLTFAYTTAAVMTATQAGIPAAPSYATVAGRLVALAGKRVSFSSPLDPSSIAATDYHELTDGVQIIGGRALGGDLIVFTTAGLWVIANMAYDLVSEFGDVQQPEQRELRDLTLWGSAGIAAWQEALVVPAIDGVWLVTAGTARLVSRSITPAYVAHVNDPGVRPGIGCVYRSHYLLPIVNASNDPVDLLVCRLDRATLVRGQEMWPWTRWAGAGAALTAIAASISPVDQRPTLLGAESLGAHSRLLQLGDFEHDGDAYDQDNSPVIPEIILRDLATGGTAANLLKMVELRYELVDPDSDPAAPKVLAYYASANRAIAGTWGSMAWGLDSWTDPDDDEYAFTLLGAQGDARRGDTPYRWRVNRNVRYARMRFKLNGGASRFVIRHVRQFIRPSGRM
jgi:hypothetical protein